MDILNAKLVIWDLDETFWKGTLSEGEVEPIEENIQIIKKLVDRGIMNSIVSKNDYDKAKTVLKKWDIDTYFIFPQISWNPKGDAVKQLLKICNLRAENTVFIDDNPSNLEEVKYYNPGIEVVLPEQFKLHILDLRAFKGKDDSEHSRLKQYRILEERTSIKETFNSNEQFLRASHIKMRISKNCLEQAERIYELVQRSNQLNYTKNRASLEELKKIMSSPNYECAYISVSDDYGDYGIVGFYALANNILTHFLFSCRILGFGIENYLYRKLNSPQICIIGDVAILLDSTQTIDWIEEINDFGESNATSAYVKTHAVKILMIGGCDLEQATAYLNYKYEVKREFSTVINGTEMRTSDTTQLINTLILSSDVKSELCKNIPFFDESITFKTELYSGNSDIIILSVVDDYIRGMYKHKTDNYYIGYGAFYIQDTLADKYHDKAWKYLFDNFEFTGKEDASLFEKNLRCILSKIPPKEKIIIINGIDLDVSDWIGKERVERNIEMNSVVDCVISDYSNARLLDMRKIVRDRSFLVNHDNRHFSRSVYYHMAQEIVRICRNDFNVDGVKTNIKFITELMQLLRLLKKRFFNLLKRMKKSQL